jgi:hypothetical protein
MKRSTASHTSWVATAAMVLSLAACSSADNGDGGDGLTDMQREDQTASASSTGLFNFANAQIDQRTNETSEPRAIDGIVPPADDTSEPFSLI